MLGLAPATGHRWVGREGVVGVSGEEKVGGGGEKVGGDVMA